LPPPPPPPPTPTPSARPHSPPPPPRPPPPHPLLLRRYRLPLITALPSHYVEISRPFSSHPVDRFIELSPLIEVGIPPLLLRSLALPPCHIAHQPPLLSLSARRHHRLLHLRVAHQHRLDLPRLDPLPSDLPLLVRSPHKLHLPISSPPRQVSRPVHPLPSLPIRIGHEPFSCQPSPLQISARQSRPRYVELPDHSYRRWSQT